MSYFGSVGLAKGYAGDRPYFHPEVILRVRQVLGVHARFPRALDVGCGAGLSSVALAESADRIVGLDSSRAMPQSAIRHSRVAYCAGRAEELPFRSAFDLVTSAGSINWVDRATFFPEARRLLRPDGSTLVPHQVPLAFQLLEVTGFLGPWSTRCLASHLAR